MNPPFSFRLRRKENGPFTVQKKRRCGPNPSLSVRFGQNGGRASRCPRKLIVSYRVRLGLWEQRSASPQLGVWVRLSEWLSDLTSVSFRAFRFAKRWLVRDGQSGSGGKTQVKSVLHLGARDHFRRGPRAESLSKSEPAPNDDADSTSQGLLLGPLVLAQT